MNIIKIKGGLGNQMLQYALYISMREKNISCKMDVTDLGNYLKIYNRDSIFDDFNVDRNFATYDEACIVGDIKKDFFNKVRRKLFGKKSSHFMQKYSRDFLPEIYKYNNTYFEGYWFNYKYFSDYVAILKKDFTSKKPIVGCNLELLNELRFLQNSVGIHVRLGDAVNSINYPSFGGICTNEYYFKAISILKKNINEPVFYIFSNDINKCKRMFVGNEYKFVDINNEFNGYLDLILMSNCKHNIIANSTFSFWSAILNNNINKIIVAPKKFSNILENRNDNCPNEWIRI